MFGPKLTIEIDGIGVLLRPYKKDEMAQLAELLSEAQVSWWTNMSYGPCKEDEEEWYDKARKSNTDIYWAIVPKGETQVIGGTGLHSINNNTGSCVSGIIISDKEWWNKGIASRAHIIRTWYAADVANRFTIQSSVRVPNTASRKALERVGYIVGGRELRNCFRGGFTDTYVLSWLHPERINLLYPEGLPNEFEQSIGLAKNTLETARKLVKTW